MRNPLYEIKPLFSIGVRHIEREFVLATANENSKFTDAVIGNYPLDDAIDWISSNMSPDEVFSEKDLGEWATENGFVPED